MGRRFRAREMIVLSDADIAALLPMQKAIEVVEKAMIAVSAGRANLPLRSIVEVGGPNKMGVMPGAILDAGEGGPEACFGVKLVSLFPGNPAAGYSSHQGAIVLFEPAYGSAVAMMNAGLLTAIRTAAASAVATRALARREAEVLTIVGTGEQAEHHLDAMVAVRPIREVRVVGRRADRAEAFAERARSHHSGLTITAGTDVRSAVAGACIVCTVTSASEPILLGDWIDAGTHLNIVGASIPSKREIDEEAVARAAIYVDYRPSTFAQAGEVIHALKTGRITESHVLAEIGEVLAGSSPGRRDADQITLYRSLGIAAQDLACAAACLSEARIQNRGVVAPLT
jgi:alanine dehydrogenase